MNAEEEIKIFKLQLRKRARVTAAVFGALAIIALIALEYAFFKGALANKQRIQAEQDRSQAIQEVTILKKQILAEQERSLACEKALQEFKDKKPLGK